MNWLNNFVKPKLLAIKSKLTRKKIYGQNVLMWANDILQRN